MSSHLDRAMLKLKLVEEDEPCDMPDLPQFSSCEQNSRSLIGRIINPNHQKISDVVLDMPRKW